MVGTSPELKKLLNEPDNIYTDFNKIGMFLHTGLEWQAKNMAAEEPEFLCVSLGTNDWYTRFDEFKAGVEAVRKNRHGAVIIWATIRRPVEGIKYPYAKHNNYLRDLAKKDDTFRVADWVRLTNHCPKCLAGDGIHGTIEGYKKRADLYFRAMQKPGVYW
jgi:hypothetical protein